MELRARLLQGRESDPENIHDFSLVGCEKTHYRQAGSETGRAARIRRRGHPWVWSAPVPGICFSRHEIEERGSKSIFQGKGKKKRAYRCPK